MSYEFCDNGLLKKKSKRVDLVSSHVHSAFSCIIKEDQEGQEGRVSIKLLLFKWISDIIADKLVVMSLYLNTAQFLYRDTHMPANAC